jgi:hypothetical protein
MYDRSEPVVIADLFVDFKFQFQFPQSQSELASSNEAIKLCEEIPLFQTNKMNTSTTASIRLDTLRLHGPYHL